MSMAPPVLRKPDQGACTSSTSPLGQGALNFMSPGPGTEQSNTCWNEW